MVRIAFLVFAVALWACVLTPALLPGCSGSGPSGDVHGGPDGPEAGAIDVVHADGPSGLDSSDVEADLRPAESLAADGPAEAEVDSADVAVEADSAGPAVCLAPPAEVEFVAAEPALLFDDQGVNDAEMPHFEKLADALLSVGSILFVDTYLSDEGLYLVRWKDGQLKFKRELTQDGPTFEVVETTGGEPFLCTDPTGFNSYEKELEAGENPAGTALPEMGYAEDDPRVSFIDSDKHCYPFPFLRIAQLFDSPQAPDFQYAFTPWGVGGGGSHGALDVSQSRAPLVIAGKGIRKGFDELSTALSVDIPATLLYLMGALPGEGVSHGLPAGGTYLKWQDGEPIPGLLEEGSCVEPFRYGFIFLFDGLQSNELVHDLESDEVDLPAFESIAADGLVFRNGAIVGFPSVSVPGHLSIGTGMLNGHHNFLANGFYYRKEKLTLAPGQIMADAEQYLKNPDKAMELFDFIFNPAGETIFQAAHRHFGEVIFAASVNELTLPGADFSLIDMARAFGGRDDYFDLADTLAIPEILGLLDEHAPSGRPMLFYVSFFGTDNAGESCGPHGDCLRNKLVELDGLMQMFLDRLDELGIRDRSAIILTADHGMELQDKGRFEAWGPAIAQSGVKIIDPDGFGLAYIPAMRLECEIACPGESSCAATVVVTDDDTQEALSGVQLLVTSPDCPGCTAQTDATGQALLPLPGGTAAASLSAAHPSFNPAVCQAVGGP
jgi:hypothetical protein